ncbi:4350_t:CDS:2 [Diversispora eburnea]|uniref:4350_t:CDS:1 n=1 Tax=Diversispora eburnea TaxID=1213867 RepID=A0A9N9AJ59_9GLOM|nr:4350_t:CDS:2 [Diversispora eburnea]
MRTYYVGLFTFFTVNIESAQTDAPPSQSKVPFSPIRVYKVTLYLLNYLYEMITEFIPSMLEYFWHRLSSQRMKISNNDHRYGPNRSNKLDVYSNDRMTGSPVIIFINTGIRASSVPIAQNLHKQGYVVVVPDITLYPKGKITEMVADVQHCIFWTSTRIRKYGGDPSQIYLMGHSTGVLISALTVIHDVCSSLNILPINNSEVQIPIWDKGIRLPRLQGLIFFSGIYDVTYYYAYLHHLGLEQIHSMPRVMGNTPESLLQCSPSYLLNHALNNMRDRLDELTNLLPKKVLLIHGAQDTINPPVSTQNFFYLLESVGISSVQLKIYENTKYINPLKDLIIPNKKLCKLLSEDIKECCQNNNNLVIMNEYLNERRGGGESGEATEKTNGNERSRSRRSVRN